MNRTEAHPIELAIVAALVVAEALLVLVVAVAALVVTLAQWRPAKKTSCAKASLLAHDINTAPSTPAAPPLQHPLAALVAELQLLPVATLRGMAGTRSKAIRKADLIAMVAACS